MKIFLSLFIFTFSIQALAECRFNQNASVVSLSGSSTVLFKELGLLKDLKGISIFNPVQESEYSGKVYPGGIFLSQSVLSEFKSSTVIYDESRELSKILGSYRINKIQIITRNKTPTETIHETLKLIIPLTVDCQKQIEKIELKRVNLEKRILESLPLKKKILFFLGEVKGERYPEMIMANDGVVKWLKENKKIETYPTELAYVNWSAKIMQDLKGMLIVGLTDPGRKNSKSFKQTELKVNISYPGILVPGLSQLEGMTYLFESLK
jgi:hypothetical protein